MNREKRIVFEVGDIVAVRVRCNNGNCDQEVLINLGNGGGFVPYECPSPTCNTVWRIKGQMPPPHAVHLVETLIEMRGEKCGAADLPVRFEFRDSD